jgi:hypothetical protein
MAEPTPRVGERWRVTIEGEVGEFDPRPDSRSIVYDLNGQRCVSWVPLAYGTWERLPDPEPEWQVGDLALDARGKVIQRFPPDGGWVWGPPGGKKAQWGNSIPSRPLRRLVPES